jgi:ribosomal protein S25
MSRAIDDKKLKKVKELVENDKSITSYKIAQRLNIGQSTAWKYMKMLGVNNENYRPKHEHKNFNWI